MQQEKKSERSRRQILDAALDLYSHQGYRGTSVRDIAERAKLSTGNVYHHFPDKETIFRTLLDEYWEILAQPDYPLNRALASGVFPDNLEAIGYAARDSVKKYRKYVALIYVDVVEFDGSHIRRFYSDMATRFQSFIDSHVEKDLLDKKLRPGVAPVSAVMLAFRFFLNYFTVEVLFGVKNHFGKETDEVIRETADMFRRGIEAQESVVELPRPRPRVVKPLSKA
ncbi:MAG: TetR/AcrR family transcriptional regulator [Thermoanaerobaculia bacterium]